MTGHVPQLGIIADDLTGGAKVASLFETVGLKCPLLTSSDALETLNGDEHAVVIGRRLLASPVQHATVDASRTAQALIAHPIRQLYFKYSALFSSTSRGNIGPVAEALMHLIDAESVLFCPARPERNATVYQGRLFLGRQMLHETPRRFDPVTPMTNSNLVEVLQSQSQVNVGLLPLQTLRAGTAASHAFITTEVQNGTRFFIADAIDQDDLVKIAKVARSSRFTTGSDDFPVALALLESQLKKTGAKKRLLPPAPGHTALLSGSCTPKSLRQLAHFERRFPVFRIDLLQAANQDGVDEDIAQWAQDRVSQEPIGVATSTNANNVKQAQHALGQEGAMALVENLIAHTAKHLYTLGVRKFLVAGGETSGTVLNALNVDRVELAIHDELLGGYCHRHGDDPLAFVLKAGAAGEEDFYDIGLMRLQQADALEEDSRRHAT